MKRILTLALAAILALALMLPGVAMAAEPSQADDNETPWWVQQGHAFDCTIADGNCSCGYGHADPFPIIEQMMAALSKAQDSATGSPVFTAGAYENGVLTFYKAPTQKSAGQEILFSVSGYYDADDVFTPTLNRNSNFNGIQNLYLTEENDIAFKGGKARIAASQASRAGLAEAGFGFDPETILLEDAVPGAN